VPTFHAPRDSRRNFRRARRDFRPARREFRRPRRDSDDELDEGHDSQDADPAFTVHDLDRTQEMETSETSEGEPPSDGVARAQLRHVRSLVQLSRNRTRVHRKEEDEVLPDPDAAFHDIHVPEDVFREAEQTRAAA
jgi:hypothetical protein